MHALQSAHAVQSPAPSLCTRAILEKPSTCCFQTLHPNMRSQPQGICSAYFWCNRQTPSHQVLVLMRESCVSLAGGLDCSNCNVSGDLLDASAMSSLAGQTWIALLPADTANCLLPHQSLVEKLQREGASGLSNPLRKARGYWSRGQGRRGHSPPSGCTLGRHYLGGLWLWLCS